VSRLVLASSPHSVSWTNIALFWKPVLDTRLYGRLLATDRNLNELRFISGEFSWRYRNRLTFERPVPAWSYTFFPYLRGEGYYSSRFNKWNETSLSAGAI